MNLCLERINILYVILYLERNDAFSSEIYQMIQNNLKCFDVDN